MGASHSGRWECKRLAELREIHRAPTLLPTVGVLEVLAHEIDVAWVTRDRQVSGGKFFAPPRALQNGKASTLMSALERAIPPLSQTSILQRAGQIRFVFWCENPDGASSNRRPSV